MADRKYYSLKSCKSVVLVEDRKPLYQTHMDKYRIHLKCVNVWHHFVRARFARTVRFAHALTRFARSSLSLNSGGCVFLAVTKNICQKWWIEKQY